MTPASRLSSFATSLPSFRSHFFVPLDEAFSAASAIPRVITANNFLGPRRAPPAGVRLDAADGRGINPKGARAASFTPQWGVQNPPNTVRHRESLLESFNIERLLCRGILQQTLGIINSLMDMRINEIFNVI